MLNLDKNLSPKQIAAAKEELKNINSCRIYIPKSTNDLRYGRITVSNSKHDFLIKVVFNYGVPHPLIPGLSSKLISDYSEAQEKWEDGFFQDCALVRSKILDEVFREEFSNKNLEPFYGFGDSIALKVGTSTRYSVDTFRNESGETPIVIEWWFLYSVQNQLEKIEKIKRHIAQKKI